MFSFLLAKLAEPQAIAALLAAFAAGATVITLALPLVEGNTLNRRMKAVAYERERIRARERERMLKGQQKVSLRQEPKAYMKQIVDRFKLGDWLGTETAKEKLVKAGFRGQQAEITFLFFRLVAPIGFLIVSLFYLFVVNDFGLPVLIRLGIAIGATFIGIKSPEIFLSNATTKRQQSIRRAWPDALDLLLICVEAGMSIEQAFRRVSQEVGTQSVALAEELTLTTAELSYLQERRAAYENLANRTGLDSVKAVTTALIQAERYGTPLGTALRVLAQESRDMRMADAEKKAAALPPKLTVPMILFFLPVLFVVIMTPALIQVFGWQ
ncbi:type II secretion system F family protein [Enterovirga aerilata]|uniref:Type II secretion system F family protein n=1 Tax=Enterovirga aerilata TaxID=2730920 RepID=A0A849IC16_9HYPH|nr:type II secretion system F family protein [Enterovirga sp. DB1703]NNM74948.1 type II secretion system F family protein [Enterovirga sp. DB1703]